MSFRAGEAFDDCRSAARPCTPVHRPFHLFTQALRHLGTSRYSPLGTVLAFPME